MGHSVPVCCVDSVVRLLTLQNTRTFLLVLGRTLSVRGTIRLSKYFFFEGNYTYHGKEYNATARPEGAVYENCKEEIAKALKLNAPCHTKNCTFNGVWNGGGGAGQNNIYATSGFYYLASHVNHCNFGASTFFSLLIKN